MGALSTIASRVGMQAASTVARSASKSVGSYTRSFGILGEVIASSAPSFKGLRRSQSEDGAVRRAPTSSPVDGDIKNIASNISTIKDALLSIDGVLKSMLSLQKQERAERLYSAEGLSQDKAATLGALETGGASKEKGSGKWWMIITGIITVLKTAFDTFVGFLKGIPGQILSALGSVVGLIKGAIIDAMVFLKDGLVNLFEWLSKKFPGLPSLKDVGRGLLTAARVAGPAAVVTAAAGGLAYMISKDRGNKDETDVALRQAQAMESGIVSPEEVSQTYAGAIKHTESVGGLPGVVDQQRPRVIPQENISRLKSDPTIGGINFESYKEAVGKRESGGNYRAENTLGFLGKYQMGVPALIDAGLMIPNPVGKNNKEKVNNPANWRGGYSKEEFLSNPELQEDVMRKYTIMNYRIGRNIGVIKKEDSPELIASKLASAHLVGWGNKKKGVAGARDYFESGGVVNPGDAYGTKVAEYASIGKSSQQGMGASMQPSSQETVLSKGAAVQAQSMASESKPATVNVMGGPSVVNTQGGVPSVTRQSPGFSETPAQDPSMLMFDDILRYGVN